MAKIKSVSEKGKAGEVKVAAPVVMMIKAQDLELGPNVRGNIRPMKIVAFAENIKANGIDTPLTVGRTGREKGPKYIIRDGARRFLGGQSVGLKEFPCQVREVGEVTTFQLRTTFREDFGAVEEAKAFKEQLKNKTLADLVLQTGKEKVYIEKRLLLLNLDAEMQQAITDGKISAGHGYVLAQVGNPASRKQLFNNACKSRISVSRLIGEVRSGETAWLKQAKFDKAECKKCPFSSLDAPDLFTQGDAEDVKGLCTKPECFNQKQIATLQVEAKAFSAKHPDITVKLTSEPNYRWGSKLSELKSSQHLYEHIQEELGAAWKNNCLKCKSLLLVLGTSGDKEFHCLNPKCLRNLLPKEKNRGSGEEEESGGGDFAASKARNRVHFTRNDFLRQEIVKNTTEDASLIIAVYYLTEKLEESIIPEFLELKKLVSAKEGKKIRKEYYSAQGVLLSYLVKFNNSELHDAVKFFSAKNVEHNNQFNIEQLVNLSGVVKRSLTDFRVTEDYLNSMTKEELVKLAGEFKLTLPKLEKKGELVKVILDADPGKAPAEITKEDYREEDEE